MIADYDTWAEFEENLFNLFDTPEPLRSAYLFRGQADAAWSVQSTLDRLMSSRWLHERNRESLLEALLASFVEKSRGLTALPGFNPDNRTSVEMLARHHGLPTSIIDWSKSAYIAAFFAFSDPVLDADDSIERVAIWSMSRSLTGHPQWSEGIDVIEEHEQRDLEPIVRAIEQRAVFVKMAAPLEFDPTLGNQIHRFSLPVGERDHVLTRLDAMGINAKSLFRDLDSAARTTLWSTLQQPWLSRTAGEQLEEAGYLDD